MAGVVAITLVSEAASKMVSTVIGSRCGISARLAVGFLIDHLPVVPDQYHGARDQPVVNRVLHLLIHRGRAGERFLRSAGRPAHNSRSSDLHCSLLAISSSSFARSASLEVMPWASCVVRSTVTRL